MGANIRSCTLLHGTSWMPSLENTVLFLEMAEGALLEEFDRLLESIMQQSGFSGIKGVQGVVIGRFQKESPIDRFSLKQLLQSKAALRNIPVIIYAHDDFHPVIMNDRFKSVRLISYWKRLLMAPIPVQCYIVRWKRSKPMGCEQLHGSPQKGNCSLLLSCNTNVSLIIFRT